LAGRWPRTCDSLEPNTFKADIEEIRAAARRQMGDSAVTAF
jgi:hypothetical protein